MTRQHTAVLGWAAALLLAAGFTALGHWQLLRMQQKQQLLEQAAHVREHPVALRPALARQAGLQWATGPGRFLPQRILLDNQMRAGRAGLRVYQPFVPE
ncbi:SURF1 family protein, partial [Xanthomonas sp. Kuri4-1]